MHSTGKSMEDTSFLGTFASKQSEVNIMLLGSTGSGKSASGNTIMGRARHPFEDDLSPESVTRTCQSAQTELGGHTITVIDTVGLSKTSVEITDAQTQIERMLTRHSVDVFLLVIKLGETFSKSDSKVVRWIQDHFGAKALKRTFVLFTHGDQLHGTVERYLNKCKTLRSVVNQCSGGFHVFNNKKEDRFQVTELLKEINKLRQNQFGKYTKFDYMKTQDELLCRKCFKGAALGGVGGGVLGGIVAGAGVAMASLMGTAFTIGQAALIGALWGAALAAGAVGYGVYVLAKKPYS